VTTLLDSLRLLRNTLLQWPDRQFVQRVAERFRDEYVELFERDKRDYLNRVLDAQALSNQEIAKLLGYGSRSAVNSMREGKIGHDKFELLVATLGARVLWPSARSRKVGAAIATMGYVQEHELKRKPLGTLDVEGYECLEQAFCEDPALRELEFDGETEAWLSRVFRRVSAVIDARRIVTQPQFAKLIVDWGPAYAATKGALSVTFMQGDAP